MSTYNGEKYLREQIESIINQRNIDIKILVRDDGSTDGTLDILEEYKRLGILDYYTVPNLKPAMSFMDLIFNTTDADYYAFCDQDDYWMPEKLIEAVKKLNGNNDKPSLYFSKALLVDERLKEIKHKGYPIRAYTFGEALIKNNATGCTMVFNKTLLSSVKKYQPKFISMHDHWIYLVCLALDGVVYYDTNSYILYRQHSNNVVGGRRSIVEEYGNKFKMLVNRDMTRYRIAKELKNGFYDLINQENREILDIVVSYPDSLKKKIILIRDPRIRTKSLMNNLLLYIAVIFNAF
jgi:rhamnosyltransferase